MLAQRNAPFQPTFRTLTVTHQKNIEKVVHKTYKQVIAKEN
ncbi:hypothetical protein [Brunnivagina elsteri]|nr:hypothetical protein [Calothrix elsteri]